MKTYSAKLKLDFGQRIKLETLSMEHRLLYNHLLGWLKENKLDFKALNREYVEFRHAQSLTIPSKSAQLTCLSLIANIKSYLALKKTDPNARFPCRFKSWKRGFTAFEYDWNSGHGGFKLIDDKLTLLNVKLQLQLPKYLVSKIKDKSIAIIRFIGRGDDIYLQVVVKEPTPEAMPGTEWIAIDPGLKTLMTGVTSTGQVLTIPRQLDRTAELQLDALQSKRDKKVKYSRRHDKLTKTFRRKTKKQSNKRKDYHHKVTSHLVKHLQETGISTVIYGDIQTKNLAQSKTASPGLNRATQNRGDLGRVKSYLAYKAEQAGMTFVLQNEAYTSRTNCLTGEIWQEQTLADRTFEVEPGLVIDRDVNGAVNIAQKCLRGAWSASSEFLRSLQVLGDVLPSELC